MTKTLAVIRGDCIGPEIMAEALAVLDTVAEKFGHTFKYIDAPMGGEAIDKFDDPLPQSSLDICLLTSLSETFPYALTDAAKYRVPVIATAVGGVVVSNPMAKNTTSLPGLSRAIFKASSVE